MGNNLKTKRTSARRAATFLAALGVLVRSSGVALMVTATPANAAQKVTFCHSTGSESDPWIELTTSVNAFYVGHVLKQHTSDIYPAVSFQKGGQTINVSAQGDQSVLDNNCGAEEPPPPGDVEISVDIEFTDPSCANANTASYIVTGDNEDVLVEQSAAPAPGVMVTVTATPKEGFFFDGAENYSETHTFGAAQVCDTVVSPPVVNTPKTPKAPKPAVTPTVVHAGLAGTTVQDVRGEQGLALMLGGMLMLAGAGGLRLRGRASRI